MKLVFATDNEPLSKVIRAFTSCPWHHVAVLFDDEYVIEARFVGVIKTPLEEFKARGKYAIVDFPLKDEQAALEFAEAQIGKKYDYTGLIGFPFQRNWQHYAKWYCTELVAAITAAGKSPIIKSDLPGISPRDLWVISQWLN